MIFPQGAGVRTTPAAVAETVYDVVIVGGGICGALMADHLSREGRSVLVLEAGPAGDMGIKDYEAYLNEFYAAAVKDNQSPYPVTPTVPMPRSSDARPLVPGEPNTDGYLVQNGPHSTDTTYTRVLGGTTMHWEAKILRMLPEDFELAERYEQGPRWPLGYADLEPDYREVEREIGVCAEVEDQQYLGMTFPRDYVYPMRGLPQSYLDRVVARDVDGTKVELGGHEFSLRVRPFPQGRNGIPNPAYDNGRGFVPVGAVSTTQVEEGERCQGNNNCVPLCPVQAKYHAGKTLSKALQRGVEILTQAVAYQVHTDPENGRVTQIEYRRYRDPASVEYETGYARGRTYVLATNAIENARLMLASGLQTRSDLIGRNLMDHAYLLTWGLLPEIAGTGRGTNCTSGIVDLRGGAFRRDQASFSVDIHNDGWGWATGSPVSDLIRIVDEGAHGFDLRRALVDQVSRQLLLAHMIEVLPERYNTVTVDPQYRDQLGNLRPVISFSVPDYSMKGAAFARHLSRRLFAQLGVEDHTEYRPQEYGYVEFEDQGYRILGGNHLAGTHIMGSSPGTSVVDPAQRSWEHANLYLVGGGSMPTIGTANITLTAAALCLRTARHLHRELQQQDQPLALATV
ncbi:GMC family oxidoreductase [Kineosporia sp. NBRC 101731]|uniref:GMC family oxidoreductase n=1 Tax=Kineosporia sp. NBRC 101731 TaxID=3032199 RepID=UPI002554FA3C|nr:GMC family oxidoreductase [Kineosporia sp. NBRC 101731]